MENKLTVEEIKKFATILTLNGGRTVGKTILLRMSNELLEYKQIEQDLGIKLSVLFKALKNGVWVKAKHIFSHNEETIWFVETPSLNYISKCLEKITSMFNKDYVYLEDYGKTWALTKEELEK